MFFSYLCIAYSVSFSFTKTILSTMRWPIRKKKKYVELDEKNQQTAKKNHANFENYSGWEELK